MIIARSLYLTLVLRFAVFKAFASSHTRVSITVFRKYLDGFVYYTRKKLFRNRFKTFTVARVVVVVFILARLHRQE